MFCRSFYVQLSPGRTSLGVRFFMVSPFEDEDCSEYTSAAVFAFVCHTKTVYFISKIFEYALKHIETILFTLLTESSEFTYFYFRENI